MTKFTTLALIATLLPAAAMAQNTPGSHFIENWDLNGDGTVSLAEATEKRGDVFFMFDTDEDNILTAAEYQAFDETRAADMAANVEGQGKHGDRAQEGMMLAFNDTDGDGAVSRDEFIAKTAQWLAMIDRNGDGMVTGNDFGPHHN